MIVLNAGDRRPIYEQITGKLTELIMLGVLEEDSALPSVRSLAAELSVNPNTVQRAYAELERLGYIRSVKGKGNFVSENAAALDSGRQAVLGEYRSLCGKAKSIGIPEEQLKGELETVYGREGRELYD